MLIFWNVIIWSAMNLLMIIIFLFAVMVAGCISYIAWKFSSGKFLFREIEKSEKIKASKNLPNAWLMPYSENKQLFIGTILGMDIYAKGKEGSFDNCYLVLWSLLFTRVRIFLTSTILLAPEYSLP